MPRRDDNDYFVTNVEWESLYNRKVWVRSKTPSIIYWPAIVCDLAKLNETSVNSTTILSGVEYYGKRYLVKYLGLPEHRAYGFVLKSQLYLYTGRSDAHLNQVVTKCVEYFQAGLDLIRATKSLTSKMRLSTSTYCTRSSPTMPASLPLKRSYKRKANVENTSNQPTIEQENDSRTAQHTPYTSSQFSQLHSSQLPVESFVIDKPNDNYSNDTPPRKKRRRFGRNGVIPKSSISTTIAYIKSTDNGHLENSNSYQSSHTMGHIQVCGENTTARETVIDKTNDFVKGTDTGNFDDEFGDYNIQYSQHQIRQHLRPSPSTAASTAASRLNRTTMKPISPLLDKAIAQKDRISLESVSSLLYVFDERSDRVGFEYARSLLGTLVKPDSSAENTITGSTMNGAHVATSLTGASSTNISHANINLCHVQTNSYHQIVNQNNGNICTYNLSVNSARNDDCQTDSFDYAAPATASFLRESVNTVSLKNLLNRVDHATRASLAFSDNESYDVNIGIESGNDITDTSATDSCSTRSTTDPPSSDARSSSKSYGISKDSDGCFSNHGHFISNQLTLLSPSLNSISDVLTNNNKTGNQMIQQFVRDIIDMNKQLWNQVTSLTILNGELNDKLSLSLAQIDDLKNLLIEFELQGNTWDKIIDMMPALN